MYRYLQAGTINIFNLLIFAVLAVLMVMFVVAITVAYRKIPVQYAKRVVGRKMYGGHTTYIPLKVNQAGVMPIIFASSVLMFPVTIAQFIQVPWVQKVASYLQWGTPLQTTLYVLLILFFTYFYTAVSLNIPEMCDNIKKYGGFIPGLRPGKPTIAYLDKIMNRITFGRGRIPRLHCGDAKHHRVADGNLRHLLWRYGTPHRCWCCPRYDEAG